MKAYQESKMQRGWFVGNFNPTCFGTDDVEVAVKRYRSQDCEKPHMHKVASELTFVISGKISMNSTIYSQGDIVLVEPGEFVAFEALEDSVTVVVKVPCVKNDKYENEQE